MKTCTKCLVPQEITKFNKQKGGKYGVSSRCRLCNNAASRAWNAAHPERMRESLRAWNAANSEHVYEYSRARNAANPERRRALHRAWNAANPERKREYGRTWRAANPDRRRESIRAWWAANPDKVNAKDQRRRALKLSAFVEDVYLSLLLERDQGICGICHAFILEGERPSIDHILPLSKRGQHSYANTQLAHLLCNIRKGDRITGDTLSMLISAYQRGILRSWKKADAVKDVQCALVT